MNTPFCNFLFWIAVALISGYGSRSCTISAEEHDLRVLSFNILQGGGNAANVGFPDRDFGGSRIDEIAEVILLSRAQIVGIQEDDGSSKLFNALGSGWQRAGSIYAKFPLEEIQKTNWMTVAKVNIAPQQSIIIVNCHWRPSNYGPGQARELLLDQGQPKDLREFAERILKSSDKSTGNRSHAETLDVLKPFLEKGETIIVTGDFNEPSHLDWTARYAERGADRWVKNRTDIPLRFEIPWKGSQLLANAGLIDAYRRHFKDEVARPGNTWTPEYPANTPGRLAYSDQVNDRIDMIYFSGSPLHIKEAAVMGESAETAEIVYGGRWPSDHRAVLAVFDVDP